ncbi:MAG: AzlD domain-containing protein [Microbacteriaceae bacterium]|nr:AzlD domain-containing protein [Microbacteriaceae bacterium]
MNVWLVIAIACLAAYALKLSGYFVPAGVLERPRIARTADLMTVGLLAALVATQTLTAGAALVLDARVPAVVLAGVLLALRVPFIVVVLAAAGAAAGLRALGWLG